MYHNVYTCWMPVSRLKAIMLIFLPIILFCSALKLCPLFSKLSYYSHNYSKILSQNQSLNKIKLKSSYVTLQHEIRINLFGHQMKNLKWKIPFQEHGMIACVNWTFDLQFWVPGIARLCSSPLIILGIMLNAILCLLFLKLCWHNKPHP